VYNKINEVHIELYTDMKGLSVEEKVTAVPDRHGIYYIPHHFYDEKGFLRCGLLDFLMNRVELFKSIRVQNNKSEKEIHPKTILIITEHLSETVGAILHSKTLFSFTNVHCSQVSRCVF